MQSLGERSEGGDVRGVEFPVVVKQHACAVDEVGVRGAAV